MFQNRRRGYQVDEEIGEHAVWIKTDIVGEFGRKLTGGSSTFFPPKARLVWEFFPDEAQKIQTVLMPKAEGHSLDFWGR